MLDNTRMTIASRSHQRPVHHLPAIVFNRIPRERGHLTIRFLHDQIRCRKVPVATLAACKGGIEVALRDPAQPKRQRSYPRMQRDVVRRRAQRLHQRLRTGDAGEIQIDAGGRADRLIVERRGLPATCEEELIGCGRKYRREHRRGIFNQRHADAPVLAVREIGAGAVDRIDDPDQPLAEPRFVVDAFLGEPAFPSPVTS